MMRFLKNSASDRLTSRTGQLGKLMPRSVWLILMLMFSLLGMVVIKETTSFGAGLRPDSHTYLSAAEQIVAGKGYVRASGPDTVKPITNFPPLYSYSLALVHALGFDVYPSARVLSGILFGSTVLAVGVCALMATKSYLWSLYCALLVLSSPVLIELYSYALSESLYLFLTSCAFILLAARCTIPGRYSGSIVVGVIFAAVFLTRYVGISALIAGYVSLLWNRSGERRHGKIKSIMIVGLLSSLPMLGFLIRNAVVGGSLANRPAPFWHPPGMEQWVNLREVVLGWFIPQSWTQGYTPFVGLVTSTLVFALLLALAGYNAGRRNPLGGNQFKFILLQSLSTYFIVYFFVLGATVFLLDSLTPINNRLLSPLLVTGLILLSIQFSSWWEWGKLPIRLSVFFLAVYLLGNNVHQSSLLIPALQKAPPHGYASSLYRSSPTIRYLREHPANIVYSNDLPALFFWAGLDAIYIPSPSNPYAGPDSVDEAYASSLDEMHKRMVEEGALLVILGSNPTGRIERTHWDDLTRGLTLIVEYSDGIIFGSQ